MAHMTLQATLQKVRQENTQLKQTISYLEEQLAWLKRQIFGPKSEKTVKTVNESQLLLEGFDQPQDAKPEDKKQIPAHERKRQIALAKIRLLFLLTCL